MQATQLRSLQLSRTAAGCTKVVSAAAAVAHNRRAMQAPALQPAPVAPLCVQQRQRHHQHHWTPLPPLQAASGSSSSSSGSSEPQKPVGWLSWFDRLPPQTQLMVMGGLLFIGAIVIPFFQPTFLYGDGSMDHSAKPGSGQIVQENPYTKKELPRYIPVASELYSFLQDNAMPRTLPDGRTESPGVLRIYLASMAILATFYACSAVLSLILRGVAGILRAVGIMGPAPPPPPKTEEP